MDVQPADMSPGRGGSSRRNGRRPRAKIPLACQPCRNRKSRCDGARPMCTRCQRRGLAREECVYRDDATIGAQSTSITALQDRVKELEDVIRNSSGTQTLHEPLPSSSPPTRRLSAFTPAATDSFVGSQPRQTYSSQRNETYHPPSGLPTRPSAHSPSPAGQRRGLDGIHLRQPLTPYEQPGEEAEVTAMGTVVSETGLDKPGAEDHTFYGTSSAAAFIREACRSLGRSPSSSVPDQNNTGHLGGHLATPVSQQRQAATFRRNGQAAYSLSLPPRSLADHLIRSFFERVYHLYPFFDRATFEAAYRKLWEAEPTSPASSTSPRDVGLGNSLNCGTDSMVFHCALNALFALACHFSDLPPADREPTSDMFFQKTKAFVGIGLIEHNSLGVVQALLIISLYLQSTAFPDRCWNSVGIACRLAQGLGLHIHDDDGKGGSLEAEVRKRTWYCCVILDMNVSMTFGRPPMTSTIPDFRSATSCLGFHDNDDFERSTEDDDVCFFVETFRLSQILEEILRTIYQPWRDKRQRDSRYGIGRCGDGHHGRLDSTIELDAHLSRFEQSLPHFLSWTREYDKARPQPTANHARSHFQLQKNVLHGRFLYVRLMLYRPLLSRFWSSVHHATTRPPQNRSGASSPLPSRGSSSLIQSSFASECCKHCVTYSMKLISLTHESFLTQHTTSWWWNALYSFTCGFVFTLALSCPPVRILLDAGAVEQSWQQCQTILESISTTSLSVQKSLHLLRRLYDGMVTRSQATALDVDNVPATGHPVDATNEAGEMGMNADRFTNMDDFLAETIDTNMIETLFNSLGSGIAFGDDIIS
ncbi:hypothetical protein CDD83_8789 [Cordyceps sp. RAO-2017]|nr:hypothetical protein CDD83_8789 [Cordyceps sp. RAO-2017]